MLLLYDTVLMAWQLKDIWEMCIPVPVLKYLKYLSKMSSRNHTTITFMLYQNSKSNIYTSCFSNFRNFSIFLVIRKICNRTKKTMPRTPALQLSKPHLPSIYSRVVWPCRYRNDQDMLIIRVYIINIIYIFIIAFKVGSIQPQNRP